MAANNYFKVMYRAAPHDAFGHVSFTGPGDVFPFDSRKAGDLQKAMRLAESRREDRVASRDQLVIGEST